MRKRAFGILVATFVMAVASAPAHALCLDGDADADTVCDGVDNCPTDPNLDQSDVDGDLAGDVCDPVDGVMLQPKVTLKLTNLGMRGQGKAYVQTAPPVTVFDVTTSVTATLSDGGGTVLAVSWSAADCLAVRGTTRCVTPDRSSRLVMKPLSSAEGVFRMRVRAKLGITATSFQGPGTVELTRGDVTHQGIATLCSNSARSLSCRYPPL